MFIIKCDMKMFFLFALFSIVFSACEKPEPHDFKHSIWCIAKHRSNNVTCRFYFFDKGEYISVERGDFGDFSTQTYGKAIATKADGTKVESLGYAMYLSSQSGYADAVYRNNAQEILEGTFYVACFPSIGLGGQFPYKAKIFTKERSLGLIIEPIFTDKSSMGIGESGYKYFEWNE